MIAVDRPVAGAFIVVEPSFVVTSNHAGDRLEFGRGETRDWWAALRVTGLDARLGFFELDEAREVPAQLGDFFADLARNWRGWESERVWQSLEGDVTLTASHDGLGTVKLRVLLRRMEVEEWSAKATLFLDAGALDRIASAARRA